MFCLKQDVYLRAPGAFGRGLRNLVWPTVVLGGADLSEALPEDEGGRRRAQPAPAAGGAGDPAAERSAHGASPLASEKTKTNDSPDINPKKTNKTRSPHIALRRG